ncbi:sugar-binding transcriptional regulator [Roseibium marinum]|uniref:DNA-binding transcriptional regulator LsrR (DeoR family) n=1 Tax=Roseibium marinum TaxID=281252 RepID=A0A2S3ULQ1_9HYPH|nr:sugar-binding transcriptional regulator [Roseibium marinum]POF28647.1 DNA-binding transcriptional regulator LsrR (DeoR family) [Roseibium marinum]
MTPGPGRSSRSGDAKTVTRTRSQDEAIIEVTWCYYQDGMNQNEIAERLGISRATVVNYLSEARRRDYVRITLDSDIFRDQQLARALVDRFGLRDAIVVPSSPDGADQSLDRVTRVVSDWLPSLLEPGDRLGVAWGETVYRVAEAAPRVTIDGLTVVQLVGSRPAALGFAAETCSATLARRYGAHCVNLHVPLLLSDKQLVDRLKQEPVIREQLEAVADCNKTIFACGTCTAGSHVVHAGLLDRSEVDACAEKGAIGVICGRLIDHEGNPVMREIENRMIAVTLDQMKNKDMGLLVGSGPERAKPMLAAIRGGYATHVATCSQTAAEMLELA